MWFITTSEAVLFWLEYLIRPFVKANFHNFWVAMVLVSIPKCPAVLNVQCSCGWGASWVRFTLFWSVCKHSDIWLSLITFFAAIWKGSWTMLRSILSESFLTFYANLSYGRTMGGNVFPWDTFSGSHLIGKARLIYILDCTAFLQKDVHLKKQTNWHSQALAGTLFTFFEPYV